MAISGWLSARTIKFGPWKAYRASRELVGPAGTQVLEPEVMELLFMLHSNAEEGQTRDRLFKKLWPRGDVPADALARCVSKLREALGDDPLAPKYIVTHPQRNDGTGAPDPDHVVMQVPVRPWLLILGGVVIVAAFFQILLERFD